MDEDHTFTPPKFVQKLQLQDLKEKLDNAWHDGYDQCRREEEEHD